MQFEKKICSIGDSLGIIIPSDVLSYLGLEKGDDVVIQVESGKKGKYISVWKKV